MLGLPLSEAPASLLRVYCRVATGNKGDNDVVVLVEIECEYRERMGWEVKPAVTAEVMIGLDCVCDISVTGVWGLKGEELPTRKKLDPLVRSLALRARRIHLDMIIIANPIMATFDHNAILIRWMAR